MLYCRALSDLGEKPLAYAFEQALKYLGEFLPTVLQLRSYAECWQQETAEQSQKLLARPDKPEPDDASEPRAAYAQRIIREAVQSGVLQMPKPKGIPKEPVDRQAWAKQKAVEMGWK